MKAALESESKPSLTWIDAQIFLCIATLNESRGAGVSQVIECVDYRQKMVRTDEELKGGLGRLKAAHLIEKRGGEYFVTESFIANLPRTATNRLSWRRRDWYRLLGVKSPG